MCTCMCHWNMILCMYVFVQASKLSKKCLKPASRIGVLTMPPKQSVYMLHSYATLEKKLFTNI